MFFPSAPVYTCKQHIALLPVQAVVLLYSHFLTILKVQRYCCRSLHDQGTREARPIGNARLHPPTCHRCLTNNCTCLQPGIWSEARRAYLALAINDSSPHPRTPHELMSSTATAPSSFTSSVAAAASCLGTSSILGRSTTCAACRFSFMQRNHKCDFSILNLRALPQSISVSHLFCYLSEPLQASSQTARQQIPATMSDLPSTYKACVYDEPGKISTKVIDLDMPEPGAGEVLINL